MKYKTHLATSLVIATPIMAYQNLLSVGNIACLSIGALFPDIDEPNSFMGERTKGISHITKLLFGHRGITHSLIGWFVITGAFSLLTYALKFPISFLFYFSLGYFLHLIEDSFSKSGVRWLLPFSQQSFQSGFGVISYQTGGIRERLWFIAMLLFFLIELYIFFPLLHPLDYSWWEYWILKTVNFFIDSLTRRG